MVEKRIDPEVLLKEANEEEQRGKGKLKIFFGYSAGVGKTYAMLDEAHSLKKSGVDVVIGCRTTSKTRYSSTYKRITSDSTITYCIQISSNL